MVKIICLDKNYSTTQLLTQKKSILKERPGDKLETSLFLADNSERKDEGGLRTKGYFKKSYDDKPLVSIITVVFNGEKYLEQTIQSVINQTYNNVEYIIIDGGSVDGTLDIIKKYGEQIDYWVSEKDAGIYDAMNKGLQLVTGEYIGILNADDFYEPFAIEKSIELIKSNDADYSVANVQYVNTKNIISPIFPLEKNKIYQEMFYPHISAFIPRKAYKQVGLFKTQFKIAGDHDMALRIHLAGFRATYLDEIVGKLTEDGISAGISSSKESLDVAIANGKNIISAIFTHISQIFKIAMVRILPKNLVRYIQKSKGSRFS